MLKATLRNGAIVPLEPVPVEWEEGATLDVAKTDDVAVDVDAWVKMMDQLCLDSPADEEKRMRTAIDEHRCHAKAQARREMGLPE